MQSACFSSVRPSTRLVARSPRNFSKCCKVNASVSELQTKYGVKDHVSVEEGNGGLTKVVLKHACGSSAEVYLFGGCVVSWKQPSGDEILYVRPDAVFNGVKPISGGIPHCFPQFGPGAAMQQHGFARNLEWSISSTSADAQPDDLDPSVELVLLPNEYTRAMWDYDFKAVYSVTLHGETLKTDFRVLNEGDVPFEFTAALHSYFEVASVDVAKVTGLTGLTYLDKSVDPNSPSVRVEGRKAVAFGAALVDSVYQSAPDTVALDVGTGAEIEIVSEGWQDIVVWNPHLTMESCYMSFVCVENAKFSEPATVAPGESWRATTSMEVCDIPASRTY